MFEKLEQSDDFRDVSAAYYDRVADAIEDRGLINSVVAEMAGCVFIKNPNGVLIGANNEFSQFFGKGENVLGRHSSSFLDRSIADVSQQTDTLIHSGAESLTLEHIGRGPDGCAYMLRTFKRSLRQLGKAGKATFGFSRPIARMTGRRIEMRLALSEQFRAYHELSESDKWLCYQIAIGASAVTIGEALGVARRTVESRKSRVYQKLGVAKGVDLARLLVHFQHRGFIDLGL